MSAATATRPRPRTHLVRALVAALLAVAAVLVLQPSGSTTAAWSDSVDVAGASGTTGSLSLAVSGAVTGSAVVTPGGTVASTWSPTAVTVAAAGVPLTVAQLAGSRLEYRVPAAGAACSTTGTPLFTATPTGTGTSFTVSGGSALSGTRTLCVTLVPGDALRASYAGVALSVTTTITAAQSGTGTWTAGQSWTTAQQLPAPLPALPEVDSFRCGPLSNEKFVDLRWALTGASGSASVQGWRVEHRVAASDWTTIFDGIAASAQSYQIKWNDLPQRLRVNSTGSIRIVAVLTDGTRVASNAIGLDTSTQRGGTMTCS
ncbi:hypothetical protein ACPYO6_13595 [Georgenia sp. Z1344]|uniref:hypothetical protein n=1 Tax=Georgenia sp. Z1344 TaxID=3416706 RepID=UPI003CF5E3EB